MGEKEIVVEKVGNESSQKDIAREIEGGLKRVSESEAVGANGWIICQARNDCSVA